MNTLINEYIVSVPVFLLGILLLIFVIYTNWIGNYNFIVWSAARFFKKSSNPSESAKNLLAQITPYFLCVGIIFIFLGYNWLFR